MALYIISVIVVLFALAAWTYEAGREHPALATLSIIAAACLVYALKFAWML